MNILQTCEYSLCHAAASDGMLRIPDRLQPFVNDYKMNLIEVRDNCFKFHNIEIIRVF